MLLHRYWFYVLAISLFSPFFAYGQYPNYLCETALPFCGEPIIQPSSTMGFPAQPGPSYPCFTGVINGVHWFYFKALSSGPVVIKIEHTPNPYCEIVFFRNIVYGHFTSMGDLCPDSLNTNHVLHCDQITNTASPPGAIININVIEGKYYYLLYAVSECGYPPQSYLITMSQTNRGQPGAGVLDCDLVYNQPCIITFIYADTTPCNTSTNTFNINGLVGFMYPPETGYLMVKDVNSGLTDIISPPFEGQSNFSIKNIPCDGQVHTIEAWFTEGECSLDTTIVAPQGDCAVGVMSGGGHICQPSGPPAEVYITAYGGLPPYSFSWSVN
ncbi:MAG: large repetitive protein, partial [Bacteroidales bacterium]|nr:large repetitive protein [Bacteroidales bacterium]MDN5330595.1 large repetitive protein [Bacteroidales bacterium]